MAPGEAHVDATCGAGGYTRAMLAHGATVIAFDRDPDAIAEGRALVAASGDRLILVEAPFSALDREIEARDLAPDDAIGRAPCWENVCMSVLLSVVDGSLIKHHITLLHKLYFITN